MTAEEPATPSGTAGGQVLRPRLVLEPRPDGVSVALAKRAEMLLNSEWQSLTEAVLHAHLLIDQALTERVRGKLPHPDVLDNRHLARLSFAQMLTVYAGLFGPELKDLQRLQAFNRLRNRVAHTLANPDTLSIESLQELTPDYSSPAPSERMLNQFFYLFFGELVGVNSAHWHDPDAQLPQAKPIENGEGQQVCARCGKR